MTLDDSALAVVLNNDKIAGEDGKFRFQAGREQYQMDRQVEDNTLWNEHEKPVVEKGGPKRAEGVCLGIDMPPEMLLYDFIVLPDSFSETADLHTRRQWSDRRKLL